jgi:hypothetical protein
MENNYGKNGEYVGFDVKAKRTQKIEDVGRIYQFTAVDTNWKFWGSLSLC